MNKKPLSERVLEVINYMKENRVPLITALERLKLSHTAFYEYLDSVPLVAAAYARAKDLVIETYAQELVIIADTSVDSQKARNQIDVRKWLLSKIFPDKYGERIELNVNQTVDIRGALEESKARVRQVLEIPKMQLSETTSSIVDTTPGLKPAETGSTAKNELDELLD